MSIIQKLKDSLNEEPAASSTVDEIDLQLDAVYDAAQRMQTVEEFEVVKAINKIADELKTCRQEMIAAMKEEHELLYKIFGEIVAEKKRR